MTEEAKPKHCEYNGGTCQRSGCADGCQAMRMLRERRAASDAGEAPTQDVKLPEPDGWIGANDLDPDAGVEGYTAATLREFTADQVRAAVLQERERIARKAEELADEYRDGNFRDFAAAIRSGD